MKPFFFLLLLISSTISAQFKGIVLDANNAPIPFVNIWVENEKIGTTSEENGQFSINVVDTNKTLIFTAMGFETLKIKIADAEKTIMKAVAIDLAEVVVRRRKMDEELVIGNSDSSYGIQYALALPWIYAKLFKYETKFDQTPFIKNTIVFTNSSIKNASFKLRILRVNKDGLPGDDLISEDIIVYVKKGERENVIDLTKYNLTFPEEGFFIACEKLLIESNKYDIEHKKKNTGEKVKINSLAPDFYYNKSEKSNIFDYNNGKWSIRDSTKKTNDKALIGSMTELSINITLTN